MVRMSLIAVVFALLLAGGCQDPRRTDAHLLVEPAPMDVIEAGLLMPGAGEADYVERVAAMRAAYREALESLTAYYRSVGNYTKGQWAQNELRTFNQMVRYTYLAPGEVAPTNLQARDVIDAADELYEQGRQLYRQGGGGLPIVNEALLRESLQSFNQVIAQYPTSNKIDDAAYHAGRVYEHLKNYELAAVYYQRAYQWNENTPYPARYRAALILDQRLKMRSEALTLYQLAVQRESRYTNNTQYARQRIAELSGVRPELEGEADEVIQ